MMLPELQEDDITEFDIPKYGQELSFSGYDVEDMIATEELGAVAPYFGPGRSGQAKRIAWARAESLKKKEAKKKAAAAAYEDRVQKEVTKRTGTTKRKPSSSAKRKALSVIRSKTPRKRRFPTKRAPRSRAEKISGVVERGVAEYKERQAVEAGFDPNHVRLAKQDALNSIAGRIRADLMPKLNAIYNMLDRSKVQTMATDEHNIIMNTQAYRRKVLGDLVKISRRVPKKRSNKNGRRRSLGLF